MGETEPLKLKSNQKHENWQYITKLEMKKYKSRGNYKNKGNYLLLDTQGRKTKKQNRDMHGMISTDLYIHIFDTAFMSSSFTNKTPENFGSLFGKNC